MILTLFYNKKKLEIAKIVQEFLFSKRKISNLNNSRPEFRAGEMKVTFYFEAKPNVLNALIDEINNHLETRKISLKENAVRLSLTEN